MAVLYFTHMKMSSQRKEAIKRKPQRSTERIYNRMLFGHLVSSRVSILCKELQCEISEKYKGGGKESFDFVVWSKPLLPKSLLLTLEIILSYAKKVSSAILDMCCLWRDQWGKMDR